MMMGFGFLFMLAVLAIPLLLIVGLVVWMMRAANQQNHPQPPVINSPLTTPSMVAPSAPSLGAQRACLHCGAGLQTEWTHCPQCGAPTEQIG